MYRRERMFAWSILKSNRLLAIYFKRRSATDLKGPSFRNTSGTTEIPEACFSIILFWFRTCSKLFAYDGRSFRKKKIKQGNLLRTVNHVTQLFRWDLMMAPISINLLKNLRKTSKPSHLEEEMDFLPITRAVLIFPFELRNYCETAAKWLVLHRQQNLTRRIHATLFYFAFSRNSYSIL